MRASSLTLKLCGGFAARLGTTPLTFPTRKSEALLAYLALAQGEPVAREKLCALLWTRARKAQAQQSLRQTLFALRQVIPPAWLIASARSVTLDIPGAAVDVLALRKTPERAAELYTGPLLDGLALDEPEFDAWLASERRTLVELVVAALSRLAETRSEDVLAVRLRIAELEPLLEHNQREILRLYAQQGRPARAIDHYRQLVSTLPKGATLERKTCALYERLTLAQASRHLFERDTHRASLLAALDAAWTGSARVVALIGEAGVGKTSLLDDLAEHAMMRGRLLRGAAFESEQVLPLATWVDALARDGALTCPELLKEVSREDRRELQRLSSEDVPASSGAPLRLFSAVTALVRARAKGGPLALLLDDLHWADELTLRLLAFVSRRLDDLPVLIVFSARREQLARTRFLQTLLRELARGGRFTQISLEALSEAATAQLCGRPEVSARVYALSEGNPFVIVEAMRALDSGMELAAAERLPIPERVAQLVRAHLAGLSARERKLVELAAVIGREFELHEAGDDCDCADRLVAACVLSQAGERLRFTHDRIREVVYADLLPAKRRALHLRVAEALERAYVAQPDAVCDRLAHHYRHAGDRSKALHYLLRFADNAARKRGLEAALAALADASTLAATLPERARWAAEIAMREASYLVYLGRLPELPAKLARLEAAVASEDASLRARCHFWLGFSHSLSGHHAQAVEHIQASLQCAPDDDTAKRAHGLLAYEFATAGQYRRGLEHGRCATSGTTIVEPEYQALAFMNRGLNELGLGQLGDAIASFERAAALAHAEGIERVESIATGYAGYARVQRGEAQRGLAMCRRAIELACDPVSQMSGQASLGCALVEAGEPEPALAILPAVLALVQAFAMRPIEGTLLVAIAEAHYLRGDLELASQEATRALELSRTTTNPRAEARAHALLARCTPLPARAAHQAQARAILESSGAAHELSRALAPHFPPESMNCEHEPHSSPSPPTADP